MLRHVDVLRVLQMAAMRGELRRNAAIGGCAGLRHRAANGGHVRRPAAERDGLLGFDAQKNKLIGLLPDL